MTWRIYSALAGIIVVIALGTGANLVTAGPEQTKAFAGDAREKVGDVVMSVADNSRTETSISVKCDVPDWIGEPVDERAVKEAAGNRPYRIYGVNDMVTMDYKPKRLNVIVDEERIVQKVKCG